MGYTHYFNQKAGFTDAQWAEIKKSLDVAIKNLPKHSTSAGGEYESEPLVIRGYNPESESYTKEVQSVDDILINEDGNMIIAFNGDEDEGLDHESMVLSQNRNGDFNFCKTNIKPYDWLVVALLAIAHAIAPDAIEPSSDGDTDEIQPVIDWLNEILPEHNFKNFAENE